MAVDAFRGTFPFARTDWDRPNATQNFNWTSTLTQQPDQRVQLHALARRGVHQRVHRDRPLPAQPHRHQLSRTSSRRARRSRTRSRPITIDTFTEHRRRPVSGVLARSDHTFSNATTYVKGRHTFKAGVVLEYSGEDDFDQINVNSIPGGTNNQNGQFAVPQQRDRRAPAWASPTWRSGCSPTTPSSASAPSPSGARWRPTSSSRTRGGRPANMTVEGGVRWVIWPPWYSTTNNIANFDPRFYDPANERGDQPGDRPDHRRRRATTASSCRATASRATAAISAWRRIPRCWRCSAASRAASRRPTTTSFEPRLGVSYSLNDKTIATRRAPACSTTASR